MAPLPVCSCWFLSVPFDAHETTRCNHSLVVWVGVAICIPSLVIGGAVDHASSAADSRQRVLGTATPSKGGYCAMFQSADEQYSWARSTAGSTTARCSPSPVSADPWRREPQRIKGAGQAPHAGDCSSGGNGPRFARSSTTSTPYNGGSPEWGNAPRTRTVHKWAHPSELVPSWGFQGRSNPVSPSPRSGQRSQLLACSTPDTGGDRLVGDDALAARDRGR